MLIFFCRFSFGTLSLPYYAGSHSDDFIEANFIICENPRDKAVIINSSEVKQGIFKIFYISKFIAFPNHS